MSYPVVPFSVILNDSLPRFQGHGVIRPIDAFDVLCAQLTRDLFATAKFLFSVTIAKYCMVSEMKRNIG